VYQSSAGFASESRPIGERSRTEGGGTTLPGRTLPSIAGAGYWLEVAAIFLDSRRLGLRRRRALIARLRKALSRFGGSGKCASPRFAQALATRCCFAALRAVLTAAFALARPRKIYAGSRKRVTA